MVVVVVDDEESDGFGRPICGSALLPRVCNGGPYMSVAADQAVERAVLVAVDLTANRFDPAYQVDPAGVHSDACIVGGAQGRAGTAVRNWIRPVGLKGTTIFFDAARANPQSRFEVHPRVAGVPTN